MHPTGKQRTRRVASVVAGVILALSLSACAGGQQRPLPPDVPRTTVRVENRSFYNMTIFVLRGSERVRLGHVPGTSTRTFTIPDRLVFAFSRLRFLADPLGSGREPVSQEIAVQPGDEVKLYIPPM